MKKIRNLHLWIGLLTSLLILIEAVTGLLMIEPWLIDVNQPPPDHRVQLEREATGYTFEGAGSHEGNIGDSNQVNKLIWTIRMLHAGKIGQTDLSILLDIVAISLIVLTTTGIILTIRKLRAQNHK